MAKRIKLSEVSISEDEDGQISYESSSSNATTSKPPAKTSKCFKYYKYEISSMDFQVELIEN